jgi:hypothetical protein
MDNIAEYWKDIDEKLEELVHAGSVKLPTLSRFNLNQLANNISSEMGNATFKELCFYHKKFLDILQINKYLTPKLYNIAQKNFSYKGDLLNQYHIARKVVPGDSKEQFRAHFDSHLFTIVLPIKIPENFQTGNIGELIYFSKLRSLPKSEISNLISKTYYKRYASKKGVKKLSQKKINKVEDFKSYQPLLFLGKTTFHTNYPVSKDCSEFRLTLLAHFFDDSPKFSVGSMLRRLRKR